MDEERARRAARRHAWPISRTTLDHEGVEDLRSTTTPEQRLAMMWELAVTAWGLSGRPIPDYPRASMPGTVRRAP